MFFCLFFLICKVISNISLKSLLCSYKIEMFCLATVALLNDGPLYSTKADDLEAVVFAGDVTALLCWIIWLLFISEKYMYHGENCCHMLLLVAMTYQLITTNAGNFNGQH